MWLVATTLAVLLFGLFYEFNRRKYNYWKSRGIFSPPTVPIFGHMHAILFSKEALWTLLDKTYSECKNLKIYGAYEAYRPKLVVMDPEYIKCVLVKDFDHFVDRRIFTLNADNDKIMNKILTNLVGDEWQKVRATMTPTFSSGKIKAMFNIVSEKADAVVEYYKIKQSESNSVDIHNGTGRFALEVISSCAFGIETKAFDEEESHFIKLARESTHFSFIRLLKTFAYMLFPSLLNKLNIEFTPQSMIGLCDIVKNTLKKREELKVNRGDFVDLLVEADLDRTSNVDEKYILLAQTLIFLLAGYSTVGNTSAIAIYHIAKQPTEQEKLRKEIKSLYKDGKLSYQDVMEAPFLDACISESTRLLPVGFLLERTCTKDYKFSGMDFNLEKGTLVSIPTYSLQHDPDYWEEPEEFRPSRFLPGNRGSIHPFTYFPFGLGPRNCIGMRFALMEVKLLILKLVSSFYLTLPEGATLKFKKGPGQTEPENLQIILTPV